MISLALDRKDVPMESFPISAPVSTHFLKVATQVRALGLAGDRVILFAAVGSVPRAEGLVQKVADALYTLDRAPVLLVNLRTMVGDWRGLSSSVQDDPAAAPTAAPDGALTQLDHKLERSVSHVDADPNAATFHAIIERARTQVRYILVNAPAVMSSAATYLAARHVDAVVLLVQKDASSRRETADTRKQFESLQAPVAGFVFLG